ncbi:MAG: hypothetical protein U9P81_01155 [Euryarchaeota archaeon]|nr:hypothetical protein [Euryarchaeota archaeon]
MNIKKFDAVKMKRQLQKEAELKLANLSETEQFDKTKSKDTLYLKRAYFSTPHLSTTHPIARPPTRGSPGLAVRRWNGWSLSNDLDPQAVHPEFMTEFRRLDYDPDKYVVFTYPGSGFTRDKRCNPCFRKPGSRRVPLHTQRSL